MSRTLAAVVLAVLLTGSLAHGQSKYRILHAFPASVSDGGGLWSKVAFDGQGNLYGTTYSGGEYGDGIVYQLVPNGKGAWTENIVHSFSYYTDPLGSTPFGWVVLDAVGNIYGEAQVGAAYGYGAVFELSPDGSGGWLPNVLWSFDGPNSDPYAGPTMDMTGNLFGNADGAFELSFNSGDWIETPLCQFDSCGTGDEGVILDSRGDLYGTTMALGAYQKGSVFELRQQLGNWQLTVLHSFRGTPDGEGNTFGQLAMDSSGNLYGATGGGGKNICNAPAYCGIVYELSPQAGGRWQETILYDFQTGPTGNHPSAGLTLDHAGNLYGVTAYGGSSGCDCGVVYELSPGAGGTWTYKVLHTFHGTDGYYPAANLVLDGKGHLYGTTTSGGPNSSGVVFEIIP